MKQINYNLSNFHKAIKRNKPSFVLFTSVTGEYYFVTQKACISYIVSSHRDCVLLELWLKNQKVAIEYEH